MDTGAWWITIHWVPKSQTGQSAHMCTCKHYPVSVGDKLQVVDKEGEVKKYQEKEIKEITIELPLTFTCMFYKLSRIAQG